MNPNVQNIPRNLWSIFKAEEGYVFVIADFSQIELRIASEKHSQHAKQDGYSGRPK